jgi:hypothetical protein
MYNNNVIGANRPNLETLNFDLNAKHFRPIKSPQILVRSEQADSARGSAIGRERYRKHGQLPLAFNTINSKVVSAIFSFNRCKAVPVSRARVQ